MTARTTKPARPEASLLSVRVQPRAAKDEVLGWQGGALRVRVSAAPESGHANRAVIGLLADAFATPRSSIELVRGATGRDKLFRVAGRSLDELRAQLERDGR